MYIYRNLTDGYHGNSSVRKGGNEFISGNIFLFQLVDPKERFGTYENVGVFWVGCMLSLSGTLPTSIGPFLPIFHAFMIIHKYANEIINISGHGITKECISFHLVTILLV